MNENTPDKPTHKQDLFDLPSYLLTRIANQYTQTIHFELKAVGLSTIATRIIVTLKVFGSATVNELCSHAIANQPTMSRALDRLEADGLVTRRVAGEDGRSRVVSLTDSGSELFERIWPVVLGANEKMMRGVSQEDRETTLRTLAQIFENLKKKSA